MERTIRHGAAPPSIIVVVVAVVVSLLHISPQCPKVRMNGGAELVGLSHTTWDQTKHHVKPALRASRLAWLFVPYASQATALDAASALRLAWVPRQATREHSPRSVMRGLKDAVGLAGWPWPCDVRLGTKVV